MHAVSLRKSVTATLRRLPVHDRDRITRHIKSLGESPRPVGAEKMQGQYDGFWRIRSGDYRIIYEISDTELTVLVVRVAQRGDAY